MDQALDIATNRLTSAAEAVRQRFRYRCPNEGCRAFVRPCLGQYRMYFRHEDGTPSCPLKVDSRGEGTHPDDRLGRIRRLVAGNGGWTVVASELSIVSLSCRLTGGAAEQQNYTADTIPLTKQMFFTDIDHGGMVVGDSFPIYPGETYLHLSSPRSPGLPGELEEVATPPSIEAVVAGTWLTEVRLPREWDTEHMLWAVANGFKPAPKPRLRWPEDATASEHMSKGSTFSALLSAPEVSEHYLSLFIGSPVEAGWSVSTELKNPFSADEVCVVDVLGLLLRRPSGEVYVRAESDLAISGEWLGNGWQRHSEGKQRAFVIYVNPRFLIHGHIVVTDF